MTVLVVLLVGAAGAATSVLAGGAGKGSAEAEGSTLSAWGEDASGELGDGETVTLERRSPVAVKGVSCAVSAAVNETDSFALLKNGTVEAWGADGSEEGELADDGAHAPYSTAPVAVEGVTNAVGIAVDTADVYILLADGKLMGWGDNRTGEFGDGPTPPEYEASTPVAIAPSVSDIKAVASASHGSTLALLGDGEVDSWGEEFLFPNEYDTLGREGGGQTPAPVEIEKGKVLTGAEAVGEGPGYSLALVDGEVKAWGDKQGSTNDLLGAGPSAVPGEVPVTVGGGTPLEGVSAIAAGGTFALALVDGKVKAWGEGLLGQLGDGEHEDSDLPVSVAKLEDIVAIAATAYTGYALDSRGRIWAWGNNARGELGTGSAETKVDEPEQIASLGEGNVGLARGAEAAHEVAIRANSGTCESATGSTEKTSTETKSTESTSSTPSNGGTPSTSTTGTATTSTTVSTAAATQAATTLALRCSDSKITLTDVVERNGRVLLDGAAVASLAGKTVKILFNGHQQVATAKIGAQGQFSASAPLPPAKLRNGNSARYLAESDGLQSLNLKLTRRLILDPPTSSAGKVTLTGQVIPPLGKPLPVIDVEQQLTCSGARAVATTKPSASGRFDVQVPAPSGTLAVLYRLATKVRKSASSRKLFPTDSLPEAVGLP
ncbi:MAG TPA: hypothetical protein VMF09_13595 [Solirubrobacteraceae bacterium]|nr:hypothetical protein [Solirubrobacteraceae bacterium]